eukprot:12202200-Alexandrium_andersonii.AAC.1
MSVTAEFTKTFSSEEVATFFKLIRVGDASFFNLGLAAKDKPEATKCARVQHTMFAVWYDKLLRAKIGPNEARACLNKVPIQDMDLDALSRVSAQSDFEALLDGFSLLVRVETSVVRGFVMGDGWKEASAAENMRAKLLFSLKDVCSVRLKTLLKMKGTSLEFDALAAAASAALDAAQVQATVEEGLKSLSGLANEWLNKPHRDVTDMFIPATISIIDKAKAAQTAAHAMPAVVGTRVDELKVKFDALASMAYERADSVHGLLENLLTDGTPPAPERKAACLNGVAIFAQLNEPFLDTDQVRLVRAFFSSVPEFKDAMKEFQRNGNDKFEAGAAHLKAAAVACKSLEECANQLTCVVDQLLRVRPSLDSGFADHGHRLETMAHDGGVDERARRLPRARAHLSQSQSLRQSESEPKTGYATPLRAHACRLQAAAGPHAID